MTAVHIEHGRVSVRRKPKPRRPEGFALIRLLCGGICNTDLELLRGYYGFRGTPGHEFAGEVIEADDTRLQGRRVTGEINLSCGRCDWCAHGMGRHCPSRTVLGIAGHPGAFSEFFVLPERNLHVLPPSVPVEHAVFAEPLAAACEILDQVRIPAGALVAVLGDGKLGLLVAQVLQAHGAACICLDGIARSFALPRPWAYRRRSFRDGCQWRRSTTLSRPRVHLRGLLRRCRWRGRAEPSS